MQVLSLYCLVRTCISGSVWRGRGGGKTRWGVKRKIMQDCRSLNQTEGTINAGLQKKDSNFYQKIQFLVTFLVA